jgi:hypothetical protein
MGDLVCETPTDFSEEQIKKYFQISRECGKKNREEAIVIATRLAEGTEEESQERVNLRLVEARAENVRRCLKRRCRI